MRRSCRQTILRSLVCIGAWSATLASGVAFAQASTQTVPAGSAARADDLERLKREFDLLRAEYSQRLADLERRMLALGGGPLIPAATGTEGLPPAPPVSDAPVTAPAAQAPPAQGAAAGANAFNPDISAIANFVGVAGRNEGSADPALQLREVEMSLRSIVDPYMRADFFLAASPEGLEIEEGYATFTSLPRSFLLKVGKMRAQFGKMNTLHTHAVPSADRPLVTENLVGGEEGISDSGLSLSKLIHNPLAFVEATGEVFAGSSSVFQSDARSRLNYVGRIRAYRDITEGSNLDLGGSVAYGPTDVGPDTNRRLIGLDATFRYRPLRRAIYKRFQARTELVWSRQDLPDLTVHNAFGAYVLGEYQFGRRWYIGSRFDRSARAFDAGTDTGGSVFLTYWPSEFSQIRGQYRLTRYAEGRRAHEFLFQLSVGIGAHGAHVF